MPTLIKFQVAVWEHVFDDLIHLGKKNHRTYRQQANHFLEESIKQAMRDEEGSLDVFPEGPHAQAEGAR